MFLKWYFWIRLASYWTMALPVQSMSELPFLTKCNTLSFLLFHIVITSTKYKNTLFWRLRLTGLFPLVATQTSVHPVSPSRVAWCCLVKRTVKEIGLSIYWCPFNHFFIIFCNGDLVITLQSVANWFRTQYWLLPCCYNA